MTTEPAAAAHEQRPHPVAAHFAEGHRHGHASSAVSIRLASLSSARELLTRLDTGRIVIVLSGAGFKISVPLSPTTRVRTD